MTEKMAVEGKDVQVAVYLSQESAREVIRRAEAEGISASAWLRRLVIRELAP